MAVRLSVAVWLLVLCSACGSTRVVRLETGSGQVLLHPGGVGEAARVELEEEECEWSSRSA